MSCPSQSSWRDHPNDIWWGVQSIKLLVMQSSPLPCYLIPLRPKYPPQHSILENPQPTFLPQCDHNTYKLLNSGVHKSSKKKVSEPAHNFRRPNGDMKQVPYWGLENFRSHTTKFSCPGDPTLRICTPLIKWAIFNESRQNRLTDNIFFLHVDLF
jgi:hypothetical protein